MRALPRRPRHRLAFTVSAALCLAASSAFAGPGISKKGGPDPAPTTTPTPTPTQKGATDNGERSRALATLKEGERLVQMNDGDKLVEGLGKMLEAYMVLEKTDGREASGVKELRSWLVKALETADLAEEAKPLRDRGTYVDNPLSVMPSTWFRQSLGSEGQSSMGIEAALEAVEKGLNLLKEGDIEGLGLLLEAYGIVEKEQGAESEAAIVVRSFIVGLLEAGNFTEEAAKMRSRGSVTAPTAKEAQAYKATWDGIRQKQAQSGGIGSIGIKKMKDGSEDPSSDNSNDDSSSYDNSGSDSSSSDSSSSDSSSSNSSSDDDDDEYKPKVFRKGSVVPSVFLDLGLGAWQPDYDDNGYAWNLGIRAKWRLFSLKFFSVKLGGGGYFGRTRPGKRWMADANGFGQFHFDFSKLYITAEGGGGLDTLFGGDTQPMGFGLPQSGYYDFGGTFGLRFGDKYGLYGRVLYVTRLKSLVTNEWRVRAAFTMQMDNTRVEFGANFYDFIAKGADGDARLITGNIGVGF